MNRIIAVNSNCYHGFTIEEAIAGIQRAGFHYIELTATKGWTEHVFPTMSFKRLCEIKEALKDAELRPFSMSGHCNLMDEARIGDFLDNIRLAHFFGCDYIVSSIGEAHLQNQAVADHETVARHLRALVPMLEKYSLTLVLETHGAEHGTGRVLSEIVRLVGSSLIKINYDTANVIFYGRVDPCEDLAASISLVQYMHLKDKAGRADEWNFPALGKGAVDFPRIFKLLSQYDNLCPFSVEIEFTEKGPRDLSEVDQAVQDSASYLRSQGLTL